MRNSLSKSLGSLLCLLAVLLVTNAKAATSYYWDINGATAGAGGATPAGSWEGANWTTDSTGASATINWVDGGFPRFAAGTDATGSYTVTANANHTIAGAFLSTGSGTVTIAGTGALTIDATGGPQQGFFGQSGFLKFTCKLTGTGGIVGQSGQIFLEGNNDYSGGTTPGGGLINFNNNNSLGTGPIIMSASGGALIAEGTSAITIPNNWTISLATATVNCVGNTAGITYSGNVALGANTFNIGCGGNVANIDIFSGIISGTGGIGRSAGQSPAGIIKFTGPNTYTGKTTLQSGITYATVLNSVASPAQQATSSFGVPASVAAGTLSIGGTTVGGTLVYVGAGETTDRVIDLAGTTGGATIQNDGTGALVFTSANTASGVGAKTLTLQGSDTHANTISGAIVDSSSGATTLTKAQAGKWVLGGANTYSGNTTVSAGTLAQGAANVIPSGTGKGTFAVSSGATFDLGGFNSSINGFGTSAGTIDNTTGSGIYTLTMGNNNGAGTHSGVIKNSSGTLALTKVGTGAITLSGANTFSGKTTVSAGTLNISSDGNLGTAPGSYVADQLTLNGGTIAFTATAVDVPVNRGITLGASGGTLSVSANQSPFIESIISGSGSLTKTTSGNINLDGANTFSGGLTITGGGVRFNNNSAAGTGTITVTPASIVTLRQLSPPGPTSVTINNPVVLNANNGNDIDLTGATGNTFTLAGPISGAGYLTISRGGTLGTIVLSGNNSYVGPTTVNAGTLQLGSSTALGGGYANPILINTPAAVAGGFLYPAQVNSAGILDLNAQSIGYSISLNGGQLVNNNASPAAVNGSPSGGVKVVFSNGGTAGITTGTTININGGGGSGAAASIASFGLTTASFTLNSGGSGYTGTLPTVAISGGGGSGATASVSRGVTAASFTITSGTTTYSVAPNVAITGGGGSGATATATLNGSGVVTGITIVTPGSGFTTAPTIAFSGGTVLVAGTNPTGTGNANNFTVVSVTVTAAGTGYSSAPTMTFGSGTASATGNANNFTITSINTTAAGSGYTSTPTVTLSSGSGYNLQAIVVNDITLLANSTIGGTGDTTVSEPIIGGFGLTKSGAGKVTLNAANTYSGATTVSAGTLLVNSPGSLAGGAVGVSSGATLGGTGTIGGLVTVSSGGTLAPGAPLGALTLTVAPSLGGTTAMDLNKAPGPVLSSDELVVSPGGGTLVYGGTLALTASGLPLVKGDTFTLFAADGYSGAFSSITPATPGPGLAWDTSRLTVDGTLKVVCDGSLAAHAGADQSLCNLGSAVIGGSPAATGGSGGYTYSWSPATGLDDATLANPTASPTTTTTYTLTVTDSVGCTAISTVKVTTGAAPTISAGPTDQTVCSGSTATFSVTATGPGTISYSWAQNNNGGWGSAWATSGSGATFRSSSTDNDFGDPACSSLSSAFDINSPSGNALGMWGGFSGDEVATRTFAALAAGQAVSIDFDNGNVDTGSKVGFSLQASGGADVLQFYFVGGQSNYKYNDGTEQDTGIPFQRTGLRVQFALTSASAYTLVLTPCGGTATRFNGTFSGTIAQLKLFNQNNTGGNDKNIYFNNFLVGGYTDNADNYSGDFAGQDKGNQPIVSGNGGSSYTTPVLSVADSGTQYQVVVSGCGGSVVSSNATVTVNPLPTVSVNSATICAGGSTTLTATTGASSPTYLWSPGGATTASITVSPASTTTYTVTVADGTTTCGNSGSGTVTVNPLPTVSVDSATICAGGSATLTATTSAGSPTYLWSPGGATTASITVSPASTTTYTVTVTDGTTSCGNSSSGTVTVNPLPTVSVNSATICAGGSTTLTATTSASTPSYLWSPGGATTASITVSPASTTTYTVTVTDGATSCGNSGSGTVTVNPLPIVSVNSATICAGASTTLTATTSASTPSYLWSPGGATTASITVSPASTTTYTVTVIDGATGCGNSGSGTVTVNPLPTVGVNSTTICAGSSTTLTATTSASSPSYLWSPGGETTASITVSPASTTTYTVTVTDGTTTCANSGSGTVTVTPLPVVTTDTTNQTACAGSAVMWQVTATGTGLTYQWQRDGTNLLEGADNFTGTTTASLTNSAVTAQDGLYATNGYACVISSGACTVTSTLVSLTVNPLPSVSVNSETVCAGSSATLTATTSAGSPTYLWSPGGATTASITVSPATTTLYTVTVTDGTTGCGNSGSGTVTVNPLPTVSVNSMDVCAGGSATLTATTSASTPSYLWSPGGATTASITVSPASTTTYTVTVTDGTTSCGNSGSGTVTVNPLPTVSVNSTTICAGSSTTLTATTGASSPSYLWSPGGETTASITISPASTTTYTVTVTDGTTTCANSGSGTVTVNPLPVVTTDTTNQTACAGSAVMWQIAATGTGLTYQWQRDGTNLLEGVDNFTGTTTASLTNSAVTAQDALYATNGYACVISSGACTVTSTLVSLTVNPLPSVSVNSETVCAGSSATLTATTSAGSPTYLWSPGGATTASITVSPATTTTYTVTVTDGTTGCGNSGSGTVTVSPLPTVSVNSMDVCAGGSATLTATTSASAPSYLWSPGGVTTAAITVSPAATTTYTVVVTDGSTGCANSGSGTVTVHSPPTVSAGSDKAVCSGTLVEIGGSPTATGGTGPYTYNWAPATGLSDATVANPAATVTTPTTYTVTVTDANGCTATSSINLTIIPTPTIETITPSGTDVTLVWSALAGQTYRVQYKNNILDASWTDLTPDVTAAGATASKTDSVGAAPQRFYRISVVCP